MKNNSSISRVLQSINLSLLGFTCLGYIIFIKSFAEIHLDLPFISVPLFIGEIIFLISGGLSLGIFLRSNAKFNLWWGIFLAYILFLGIKAVSGYQHWGGLACRHTALLYYPVYSVIAFLSFRKGYFDRFVNASILILILFLYYSLRFKLYFVVTLFAIAVIAIIRLKSRKAKIVSVLALLILTPYLELFSQSRMMLISNAASLLFFSVSFFRVLPWGRKLKATLVLVFLMFFGAFLLKTADRTGVKSVLNFKKITEKYEFYRQKVDPHKSDFIPEKLPHVTIYNPEPQPFASEKKFSLVHPENVNNFQRMAFFIQDKIMKDTKTKEEKRIDAIFSSPSKSDNQTNISKPNARNDNAPSQETNDAPFTQTTELISSRPKREAPPIADSDKPKTEFMKPLQEVSIKETLKRDEIKKDELSVVPSQQIDAAISKQPPEAGSLQEKINKTPSIKKGE
ncbi:MAG: hypothetical protein KC713_08915, partial [Candidatus Omnitrophica bacterium]|nr:hypothetical protein [Candidatus Omnitrophota bacterium]